MTLPADTLAAAETQTDSRYSYLQICDLLRRRIRQGVYSRGQGIPAERRLSQELGVARMTVSKAMAMLVNEGLLERRQGQGTFVTEAAAPASSMVGVVMQHFYSTRRDLWCLGIQDALDRCLAGRELHTHPFTFRGPAADAEASPILFEQLRKQSLIGLCVLSAMPQVAVEKLLAFRLPVVLVGFRYPTLGQSLPSVSCDRNAGARLAVAHGLETGGRRFALICGGDLGRDGYTTGSGDQVAGFYGALAEQGLASDAVVLPTAYDEQAARHAIEQLLARPAVPDVMIFSSDQAASMAAQMARDKGLDVPGDVRIISQAERTSLTDPQLTTASVNVEQLGAAAAATLMRLIDGQTPAAVELLAPDLVVAGT